MARRARAIFVLAMVASLFLGGLGRPPAASAALPSFCDLPPGDPA